MIVPAERSTCVNASFKLRVVPDFFTVPLDVFVVIVKIKLGASLSTSVAERCEAEVIVPVAPSLRLSALLTLIIGVSLTAVISTFTVPRVTFVPPPEPVFPPSLAVSVKVAASLPLTFEALVYFIFDAVFKYVSILATAPVKLSVPVPEPPIVTGPPELAVSVPVDAAIVNTILFAPASTSLNVAAERSTLLATSSETVISVGKPEIVGSSLTAVILKETDAALELTVPSLVVNEITPALVPFRLGVGVKVAASRAVFIAASVPAAVKLADPFPLPPKVIPVVPTVSVPPVIVNVTV